MIKQIAVVAALLLLSTPVLSGYKWSTTQARDDESHAGKIERALKTKEPKFKLQPRVTGGKAIKQQWRSGNEIATVNITEADSPEQAAEHLQMIVGSVSGGAVTKLEKIGHAAYIIKSSPQVIEKKGGRASLAFTQGSVVITITATSEQLAKRFAKHIDDDLKVK